MLRKRQKELLELLNQESDFQTVAFFASKLGVSKRTAHMELEMIEKYIQSSGEYLEKKRGVGIVLRRFKEVTSVKEYAEGSDGYSTFNRRIQLMYLLLFEEQVVSFNRLSETFLVSKSSIIKDLEFVMKILHVGSKIRLEKDVRGTFLSGTEEEFQKALLQFNRYLLSNTEIYGEKDVSEKMQILSPYYGEQLIRVVSTILYIYVRENIHTIADYYVQNILNVFLILVFRLIKGHHLEVENLLQPNEKTISFEKNAVKLLHKAALRLSFSYTNDDVYYLSLQLISNRFESLPEDEIDKGMVEGLLTNVSEALNINFSKDQKLEEQLKKHIPPMIYRLHSNNKTENPFTLQIKTEFSMTFNVIWVVLSEYERELGICFNEDEIAFLTMYFQAAIERAQMNRKILIVCQMGIATSELLIHRIKTVLPSLDSFEVASVLEIEDTYLESYDLIISTIKLAIPTKEVLFVSPFLTNKDIEKIKKLGDQPNQVNPFMKWFQGTHLKRLVESEQLYFHTDFSSKEELMKQVGENLIKNGYVKEQFIQTVLEREALGSTDLPSGTAIPHGNTTYVNETIIVLIKNKKKFKWNKYQVDMVFLICIAKSEMNQTRNILSDIYTIIEDSQMLKQLRAIISPEEWNKLLGSDEDEKV